MENRRQNHQIQPTICKQRRILNKKLKLKPQPRDFIKLFSHQYLQMNEIKFPPNEPFFLLHHNYIAIFAFLSTFDDSNLIIPFLPNAFFKHQNYNLDMMACLCQLSPKYNINIHINMFSEEITIQQVASTESKGTENDEEVYEDLKDACPFQSTLPIKINDDYYIIVPISQMNSKLQTPEQWDAFLKRSSDLENKLNVKELNSVLNIRREQIEFRIKYWRSLTTPLPDLHNEEEQVILDRKDQKTIRSNIQRMYKKCTKSIDHLTQNLITQVLLIYANTQKQIGYIKGLQYICYGIVIAHPQPTFTNVKNSFFHIMEKIKIKELFYEGSPLFYEELNKLEAQLLLQLPDLDKKLREEKADTTRLFITYFKTILLNTIQNDEIVRKIYELFLIYGIKIVRLVLMKILKKEEKTILTKYEKDNEEFLKYIGTNIVVDYFAKNEEDPISTLTKLIISP